MSRTCATCGQDVASGDPGAGVGHEVATDTEAVAHGDVVATRPRRQRVLPFLTLGVVALAAALWFMSSRGGDENVDDVPVPVDEAELSEVSLSVMETREVTAASGLGGMASYLSNEGLVLLNLESGEATIFAVQAEPVGMTGRLLLTSADDKTYRVDTQNPQALTTLSAFGSAAPTNISRIVHLTFEPSGSPGRLSATIMSLDGGIIGEAFLLPVGSGLATIEHFGMVMMPADGGTYEFTRDGPNLLSEHRVVAVADDVRVEVQCDETLACAPYLVDEARGGTRPLDEFASRSEFSLSPDGTRLLSFADGQLLGRELDDSSPISIGSPESDGPATWSRDSSRFAWLSDDGRVLNLADQDGVEMARLDLRSLGLPAANRPTLVLSS